MAYNGPRGNDASYDEYSSFRSEGREPGARRKKLAGYLKAANELRQSYFSGESSHHDPEDGPGAFPDAAVVRSGNEEMILFPSYGRKHAKVARKPMARPGQEISEEEYWRREWSTHEDNNAIVDVDVRGWIYTPHRGPNTRKQRLLIGLARQLSGIPAPSTRTSDSNYSSTAPSRSSSPTRTTQQDEDLINLEAENIIRKGQQEERFAARGAFSEKPSQDPDADSLYEERRASNTTTTPSRDSDINPIQKRSSWQLSTKLSPAEVAVANKHMLTRLQPFMTNPLSNSPISAFFYNDHASRQQTIYTDASGHFSFHTALDFVPTNVRVLAAEKLSVTEEVIITSPKGVSVISDIDDTIKHSAISSGPREIFRNAFVRDLSELTIEGVREWYNTLYDMGVKFHYVSNSPWQMYPALTTFFKLARLPRGSFHLKQYSGMLQGIFEPVAERKKSSLDKIMRDFPDRKFILIGDSGEADLEVYTDVALDNPGKILGIFIRDVTTTVRSGYFDPNMTPPGGSRNHSRTRSGFGSSDSLAMSKRLSRPNDIRDDEADLKAAIAASLNDMEKETNQARRAINPDVPVNEKYDRSAAAKQTPPRLPPRKSSQPVSTGGTESAAEEDLIDFSEQSSSKSLLTPPPSTSSNNRNADSIGRKPSPSPPPPPKPPALRSTSPNPPQTPSSPIVRKPPPPRPQKPSSAIKPLSPIISEPTSQQPTPVPPNQKPSPLSQVVTQPEAAKPPPPPLPKRRSYRDMAKDTISKALPAGGTYWQSEAAFGPSRRRAPGSRGGSQPSSPLSKGMSSPKSFEDLNLPDAAVPDSRPPLPSRQNVSAYTTQTRKSFNRRSGTWSDDGTGSPGEGMSKKEYMWKQRWSRAQYLLERNGVTLRTWRTGTDVADVCVKLVEMELREVEKGQKAESSR